MRLFVALEIVSPLREAIAALRGSLPDIRWADPETYHLTLRFIGEVPSRPAQEDIHHALSAIHARPCPLIPEPPGLFEQNGGQGMLWVGIARTDPLLHLQKKIDTALRRSAGVPVERRRFLPHVTIGAGPRLPDGTMSAWLAHYARTPLPTMQATRFTLFQSLRGAGRPVYEAMAEYPFAS
ncbi:RNA 2',3'-cyclic phosphodiesterase [Gluconacetobacter tumulisoli]|uniref:RNA 2',3'-cyclic phosphodiesterase n=1 Tax=Gluconacetobacter tumulisoli TaxID=1286189 RepID=A0A7W4K7H2_9PROT|nr:RNA 2',3'-cyclic phosphodiesterase [Gluconacetobacter tumulisoli]MBB2201799.1 RNA 2',3'-cyclic phosphodiesterase [Gluconacetobacter tumulisoli]